MSWGRHGPGDLCTRGPELGSVGQCASGASGQEPYPGPRASASSLKGRDPPTLKGTPRARCSAQRHPLCSPQKWMWRAWSLAPVSWTVLAAAVTWMTTTACRVVAAATVAMGPPAGGLAALASRRPGALSSLVRSPAQPSTSTLQPSRAAPWAHCCAILEAPATKLGRLSPPACPSQLGRDPSMGRAQLPGPGAQRSRPRSVLRFLIIPEVLNVIAANSAGLMTTAGSSDPGPDPTSGPRKEGRKAWFSIHPSVHPSVGPRRLLKHGQRDL